jgi:hypothetical protein
MTGHGTTSYGRLCRVLRHPIRSRIEIQTQTHPDPRCWSSLIFPATHEVCGDSPPASARRSFPQLLEHSLLVASTRNMTRYDVDMDMLHIVHVILLSHGTKRQRPVYRQAPTGAGIKTQAASRFRICTCTCITTFQPPR